MAAKTKRQDLVEYLVRYCSRKTLQKLAEELMEATTDDPEFFTTEYSPLNDFIIDLNCELEN